MVRSKSYNRRKNRHHRHHHNPQPQVIHVQHHKDNTGEKKFWAFVCFGIPFIVIFIIASIIATMLGFDVRSNGVFIVNLIISIYLAAVASKKLNRFFDKISMWLNK